MNAVRIAREVNEEIERDEPSDSIAVVPDAPTTSSAVVARKKVAKNRRFTDAEVATLWSQKDVARMLERGFDGALFDRARERDAWLKALVHKHTLIPVRGKIYNECRKRSLSGTR